MQLKQVTNHAVGTSYHYIVTTSSRAVLFFCDALRRKVLEPTLESQSGWRC